jgi:hypothetical protein
MTSDAVATYKAGHFGILIFLPSPLCDISISFFPLKQSCWVWVLLKGQGQVREFAEEISRGSKMNKLPWRTVGSRLPSIAC